MSDDQINTLTQLVQKLVAQNSLQNQSYDDLPVRTLKSIRDIANDMNLDYNSIPHKTLRGCGKFITKEYVKHYNKRPFQMHNRSCLYTKKEVKFVQLLIQQYFKAHAVSKQQRDKNESQK